MDLTLGMTRFGLELEEFFRAEQELMPHQKYVIVPFYKMCKSRVGDVAATGLSFLVGDLLFHQLLPQTAAYLFKSTFLGRSEFTMKYIPMATVVWAAVAIPVMYVKYRRKHFQI